MKYQDGIQEIMHSKEPSTYTALVKLYREETVSRIHLRSHNKTPTAQLIEGVIKEMEPWISKVAEPFNLPEDHMKTLLGLKGEIYARFKVTDPTAERQMKSMRKAYLGGRPPIEALTREGLEAIGSMMLGTVVEEVRQWTEKRLSDKPPCPHAIEARHCLHIETLFKATEENPLPSNTDQLQFYCNLTNGKCWLEEKEASP